MNQPRFLWQGTMILLPAMVLTAAGLSALRQDHKVAEHEAREEAKRIAGELVQTLVPAALSRETAPPPGLSRRDTSQRAPEDDPVYQAAQAKPRRIAFSIDVSGTVAYPPPVTPLPTPQPLDLWELDAAQKTVWHSLEESWSSGDELSIRDDPPRLETFLALAPGPRFAAIALHRSAQLAAQLGDRPAAASLLRRFRAEHPDAVGETGFPLRDFAEHQLAGLVDPAERRELMHALGARIIARPNAMTKLLLTSDGSASGWPEVFAAHEQARRFFAACSEDAGVKFPVQFEEQEFLPFMHATAQGPWIVAITTEHVAQVANGAVADGRFPGHFRIALTLGDTALRRAEGEAEVLASASSRVALAGGELPLTARISLADPAAFYAEQRARTARFGALIAFSAGAVLVGFVSAWRAFRRQGQLSEMKTNFVSSVSHELRAPIASVRLMAEELEDSAGATNEKARQYHRFIVQECRRLSAVIENVLDFSRREQGREQFEFEAAAIDVLVEETAGMMRAYAAEKEVRLETVLLGRPLPIEADARALGRLLVNLIDNAVKHSPPGGSVRIGAEFTAARLMLWVEDDGVGIPPEEHARIFERFYRVGSELRRETTGVGLGLSIVKHVAAVHGGRVLVRSAVGQGSRFTVELPLRVAQPATEAGVLEPAV